MKPQFFIDFFKILREYEKGEFDKSHIQKIFNEWVKNGVIDSNVLKHLSDDVLSNFYSDVAGVARNLSVKAPVLVEVEKDYIENFRTSDTMEKKTLAWLCERSEMWVHIQKANFKNDRNGVNLISFLSWLKVYDYKTYLIFQKNYK